MAHKQLIPFICLFLALWGIGCNGDSNTKSDRQQSDSLPSRYSRLDGAFKSLDPNGLYIASGSSAPEMAQFIGTPLDSEQVFLLPYRVNFNYRWIKDFGACGKFKLNDSIIALIIRVPGEYVSSKINLFFYDLRKDSVIKDVSLADVWGDAGESSIYNSYLFRDDRQQLWMLCYGTSSYDHSVNEDPNDTIVEHSYSYSLRNLSVYFGDSVLTDSVYIYQRFKKELSKLSQY